jgi:putative PEP-CTERM system TPR-repeat lipoprotein
MTALRPPQTPPRTSRRTPRLKLALLLSAALLAAWPAHATLERARAAQARGDLRTAQIELRNAVRADPNSGALRAALARASLDLGDGDTAEKEARAALERGFDPAQGTALLLRSYLALGRAEQLLREFPAPADNAPPAVAGQVAAARAIAQLSLNQRDEAKASAATAVRLAPNVVETNMAAAFVALAEGDRAAAEAAVDRAVAADATSTDALSRKSAFQFERGDFRGAADTLTRAITAAPAQVGVRLQRAEALLRLGDDAGARADIDAALRIAPGNIPGTYLRAVMQVRAREWRAADETLQRLGSQVANLPDGLLLLATTKQALGQTAQAEDAAQRHVARNPQDPRGAKLLAGMEMAGNRPDAAAGTLTRLAQRGAADAEAFDMLGRAHVAAGRPREAAEAYAQAVERAPNDAALRARLAATRFASGDVAGMTQAAEESLRLDAAGPAARQMLAVAALGRGDLAAAEAELGRLDQASRQGEIGRVVEGTIKLIRFDVPGARAAFETALRDTPASVPARLGLARVATTEGKPDEAERLLAEVLSRDPGNSEAAGRLAATALSGGPRAPGALALLRSAQAAAPTNQQLALTMASVLLRLNDAPGASALLEAPATMSGRQGIGLLLVAAEARTAQNQIPQAEALLRTALAELPTSSTARAQLALLLARRGDTRAADFVLEDGLRTRPDDTMLQGALVAVAQQAGGLDAALQAADRLTRRQGAMPAAATLRGDLLIGAQRPADAAQAYAAMLAQAPSSGLALRHALALQAAGQPNEALAALRAWVQREPTDMGALATLAQLELAAGRDSVAEPMLNTVVERSPANAVALNNLAWLLQKRDNAEALARARMLAERAFFLSPTAEVADTLGWIMARGGNPAAAVPLLRQAVSANAAGTADPGMTYRLAWALRASGAREEAQRLVEPLLAANPTFPERADAERLLAELRAGR